MVELYRRLAVVFLGFEAEHDGRKIKRGIWGKLILP